VFCVSGGLLVPYQSGKQDQLWESKGSVIPARQNTNLVLDIAGKTSAIKTNITQLGSDNAPIINRLDSIKQA